MLNPLREKTAVFDYDFGSLSPEESAMDGIFRLGECEVRQIRRMIGGKIEFVQYGEKILCCITSCSGQQAIYPLKEVSFEAPAEYVVMDLDGTSIASEEFWNGIIEQTVSRVAGKNVCFTEEDIPYVSGHTTQEHLNYVLNKYGGELSAHAIDVYHEISHRELAAAVSGKSEKIKPMYGLKEFLLTLKNRGVKLGLVSSGLFYKAIPEIESAFSVMGLGDPRKFYDSIVMGGVEKGEGLYSTLGELVAKPHPWLYQEMLYSGLHCNDGSKAIVLEDSASGVLSARLAGYSVIGMNSGNITASGLSGLCSYRADLLEETLKYILGN